MTRRTDGGGGAERRRLAAVPALVGIAVILTWPLGAGAGAAGAATQQSSPMTIHIDAPSGTVSDAVVAVAGRVDAGLGPVVETIRIRVVREADGTLVLDKTLSPAQTGVVPFAASTPSLSFNGPYRVVVTATGYLDLLVRLPVEPAAASAAFKAGVPPAAPANVKATVQADRSVLVTWSAVPAYADFVGYVVFRKTGSADFQPIKGITDRTTTFTDTSLGAFSGPVQYQVASIREGPVPGQDSWLIAKGETTSATVPPPPTTTTPPGADGGATTTVPAGGGLQTGGAATTDLGGFFSGQPQPIPLPPPSPPPTFPDTGFSETLPFGALPTSTEPPDRIDGRSPGRSSAASGSGDVETEELAGVNRRALLVPIAAGSVLCVTALHLRWLNRRLAIPASAGGFGAAAPPDALEVDVDPGDDVFRPGRQPVGASGRP